MLGFFVFSIFAVKLYMEYLNLHKKRRNPIWGVIITFCIIMFFYLLFQIPLLLEVLTNNVMDINSFFDPSKINLNYALILFVLAFFGIIVGLLVSMKFIHNSKFRTLIHAERSIDFKRIGFGFYIWGLLLIVTFILDYFFITGSSDIVYNGIGYNFFIAIIVSFIFLFVQTSAEELLCRGYLMQALGSIFKDRWIPIIVSGLFFGGLHVMNPEIDEYGLDIMLLHYCSVGIFLGIIVVMDNRLELALGFHAVNNILSGLLISFDGAAFKTYSLFTTSYVDPYLGYIVWLVSAIVFYVWCSYKYNWKSLSYLTGKIAHNSKH